MRTAASPFLAGCLAACVAVLGVACSGETGAPATATHAVHALQAAPAEATPNFLASMVGAPERVAHSGVRRVEVHLPATDGQPTTLVYDERITADGAGHYAIEPERLLAPSMSQPQREIFEELQRARQGFFFKYRDLRVRDLDLFLSNYAVNVVDVPAVVAGVECVEIEVTPRADPRRSYRLAVEAASGLVLRAIERDTNGIEVASSTFLEFTRTASVGDVEFHADRYPGTPLADAVLPADFVPARPQILPAGYREISSEIVELAGDAYLRRVYGDGLENVFFLQRREPGAAEVPVDPATAGAVKVRIAQVGAYCVAEAVRGRSSFFIVGKVAEADVLAILRSAL